MKLLFICPLMLTLTTMVVAADAPNLLVSVTDGKIQGRMQAAPGGAVFKGVPFAASGDPNGTGLPKWPMFDPAVRVYLEFTDNGPVAKQGLRRVICDLHVENMRQQMQRLGR